MKLKNRSECKWRRNQRKKLAKEFAKLLSSQDLLKALTDDLPVFAAPDEDTERAINE